MGQTRCYGVIWPLVWVVMLGGYGGPDTQLLWGGLATSLSGDARRLWWAKHAVMGWYGHLLGW